jgi:hypothetical protein
MALITLDAPCGLFAGLTRVCGFMPATPLISLAAGLLRVMRVLSDKSLILPAGLCGFEPLSPTGREPLRPKARSSRLRLTGLAASQHGQHCGHLRPRGDLDATAAGRQAVPVYAHTDSSTGIGYCRVECAWPLTRMSKAEGPSDYRQNSLLCPSANLEVGPPVPSKSCPRHGYFARQPCPSLFAMAMVFMALVGAIWLNGLHRHRQYYSRQTGPSQELARHGYFAR